MLFAIITIIIASSSFIVKLKFFLQIYSTIDTDKKNDFFFVSKPINRMNFFCLFLKEYPKFYSKLGRLDCAKLGREISYNLFFLIRVPE